MSEEIEVVADSSEKDRNAENECDKKKISETEEKTISQNITKRLQEIFDISTSLNSIEFTCCRQESYSNGTSDNSLHFGEKDCLLCIVDFTLFHYRFRLKVLYLQYDGSNEVLKQDIIILNDSKSVLSKEMESCLKLLRKRRSLNVLFNTLINFTMAVESRRLIILILLRKHSNVLKLEENVDGAIILHYTNTELHLRLSLFWSIAVDSVHKIKDVVYMYQSNLELQHKEDIQSILKSIGHPELHFITKYHLWKHLISKISVRPRKNLKRKHLLSTPVTNNISTATVPSTSSASSWLPFQPNLSAGAFRYLFPSATPQTPYGLFNRYNYGPYPQMRFQPPNILNLSETLRRQQQYLARSFANSRLVGNNSEISTSSHTLSESLPISGSGSTSRTETSTSNRPQNISNYESDNFRRAGNSQRSKLYQKYVKYRNQKHSRYPHKYSGSPSTERSSVIQTAHSRPKRRRGSDFRNRMVEPDVEIIDMSNPSTSQKISNFVRVQEDQRVCSVITVSNRTTEPSQETNSTVNCNTKDSTTTNLGNASTQIVSLNNNVVPTVSNEKSTQENSNDKTTNVTVPDNDCEVHRKTKKFNPFSLKFKDKLHKNAPKSGASDRVVVLCSDKVDSRAEDGTNDASSKENENIVYVPD